MISSSTAALQNDANLRQTIHVVVSSPTTDGGFRGGRAEGAIPLLYHANHNTEADINSSSSSAFIPHDGPYDCHELLRGCALIA